MMRLHQPLPMFIGTSKQRARLLMSNFSGCEWTKFRTKARAAALRVIAAECRATADTFSTKDSRAQTHRIADSYEDMARALDDIDTQRLRLATT
jgi:hypothetical protein